MDELGALIGDLPQVAEAVMWIGAVLVAVVVWPPVELAGVLAEER